MGGSSKRERGQQSPCQRPREYVEQDNPFVSSTPLSTSLNRSGLSEAQLLRDWSHDKRIKTLQTFAECVSAQWGWYLSTATHTSQWAAIVSIAAKIGCTAQTLSTWVRQAERDEGKRLGLTGRARAAQAARAREP